jgi:molybdate transport system regulatory protein
MLKDPFRRDARYDRSNFCIFTKILPMEKSFDKKLKGMQLNYKIWFSDTAGQGIFGDGKWKILKLIDQVGSIKAACDELGWTYRRTWGNLKKIEDFFGFPLLEKHRGGHEGGETRLTTEGKKLVRAFDRFHGSVDSVIQKGFETLIKDLN